MLLVMRQSFSTVASRDHIADTFFVYTVILTLIFHALYPNVP